MDGKGRRRRLPGLRRRLRSGQWAGNSPWEDRDSPQARDGFWFSLHWNCTSKRNRRVVAGVYFYRLFVRGHG